MFLLSKIISRLILPPGIFIIILIAGIILLVKKKFKLLKVLLILNAVIIYLLSTEPLKDILLIPLENSHPPITTDNKINADYIIILGGGVSQAPEENGRSSLGAEALKRLIYGLKLHKRSGIPIIVSGGIIFNESNIEAESKVAMRTLVSLGVDRKFIYQNDSARNTWEEAVDIKRLFSPERVVIVTSAYHMSRSIRCFERNGIRGIPAPTNYLSNQSGYTLLSFVPDMGSLSASGRALKEYIGSIYYYLRY